MSSMSGFVGPLTTNLISKPKTQLIAFDTEKKIRYFGPCNIAEINADARCLILTTNSTVKSLKEMAATFNRIFIQKANALCVIDEGKTNKDFMIIFPSKEFCDRIFEAIISAKYPNITPPPKNDPSADDYLFKINFYIPILKEIKQQIPGFKEIQETILEVVNLLEDDKRKSYMNIIFDILVSNTVDSDNETEIDGVQDSTVSSNTVGVGVQKSLVLSNVETLNDDDETKIGVEDVTVCIENDSLNETTKSSYGNRKRSCPNFDEMESFESDEMAADMSTSTVKTPLPSTSTTSNNEIHSYSICRILPNIFSANEDDHPDDNADTLISAKNDGLNDTTNSSYGFRKRSRPNYVEKKLTENAEMKTELSVTKKSTQSITTYKQMNIISADYQFVECFSQGAVRKRLLIFTSKEKKECYEFYYSTTKKWHMCKKCASKSCMTIIKIISAQNGKIEFIFGTEIQHICEPVKYVPQNYFVNKNMNLDISEMDKKNLCGGLKPGVIKKIIKSTNFQFVDKMYNDRISRKLIIFNESDRSCLCHHYSIINKLEQHYRCSECRTKHNYYVGAKFIKSKDNGNNGDIVVLSANEHLCQPKKFP